MQLVHTPKSARNIIVAQKRRGKTIGFVPTMGALHEGHLSLVRRAAQENDFTVVSVFVNPLQFSPNEDLAAYPRTLEDDAEAAESAGAQLIFHPAPDDILGKTMLTFVDIAELQDNLCGRSRPGHFRGVCTIVAKLFNIIAPDRAYFGQKDMQQFIILQRMVQDLNFDIDMIRCPIIRHDDGLAMSSRNHYLSEQERKDALVLHQALLAGKKLFDDGETDSDKIRAELTKMLQTPQSSRIDYVSIVDDNMRDVHTVQAGHILAIACFIGSTRLIDNYIFGDSAI